MNRIHRRVWSTALQCWVVVSELTRMCGKRAQTVCRSAAVAALLTTLPLAAGAAETTEEELDWWQWQTLSAFQSNGMLPSSVGTKAVHRLDVYNNTTASAWSLITAAETMAVGAEAHAGGVESIAVGIRSKSSGPNSVAVGNRAETYGSHAVAVGFGSRANSVGTVSIGNAARSDGHNAMAIGSGATSAGSGAIALVATPARVRRFDRAGRLRRGSQQQLQALDRHRQSCVCRRLCRQHRTGSLGPRARHRQGHGTGCRGQG